MVRVNRVLRKISSLSLIAVLAVLNFGIHASALMPQAGHTMGGGMEHRTSTSSSCITICTLATLHRDDLVNDVSEDDDDEPQTPYFLQFQPSPLIGLEKEHKQETKNAIEREPPPGGLPAYIALTVFRA